MANNKNLKIKNGLQAGRYLGSNGTETLVVNSFDVQGATYEDKSLALSGYTQYPSPQDLVLNSDGTKMYLQDGGFNADAIYEFSLSTAYDISTATSTGNSFSLYNASFNSRSPQGLGISSDDTKLYSLDDDLNAIYQIDMSTASDLSTASYNSVALTGLDSDGAASVKGFFIGNNGTKLYAVDAVDDLVYQYTLSTAWNISTATYDSVTFDISGMTADPFPTDIRFNSSGTKFFVVEASGDNVYSFSLSTAWDVSTASLDSGSLSLPYTNVSGFFIDSVGGKMYLLDNSAEVIYQYSTASLTQTLDLSTGHTFSITPTGALDILFSNPPASGTATGFSVEVDNTGGHAITWPSSVKWHLGTAPTATASKELYTFITTDGGTTYYGKKSAEIL